MLVNAEEDITVVAEASDGEGALDQARVQRPDVVIMDAHMRGTDGIEATRAVANEGIAAQNGQPIRVIILTTDRTDEILHAALRAGASGFLLKDASPAEIVSAIRAVFAGDAWLAPVITRRLIDAFIAQPEKRRAVPERMAQLTPREREVLALLAEGLSSADVARTLIISEATVKTHLARVMMKLGVVDKTQAVIAAYQAGLVQPSLT
jgi:DNA-binding NarL/FixJ family response regulator